MANYIKQWCKGCHQCQKASRKLGVNKAPLVITPTIGEPFFRVGMDMIGPLNLSNRKNRFIIVIIDHATRYPEAIPVPNMRAEIMAREISHYFCKVGIPTEILTGQGKNFLSSIMIQLYNSLGIKHIRTSTYHP